MPNHVPEHLREKVENTLALLDSIRPVEPPMNLAARIMARIHEACQPGYYPILDTEKGEEFNEEKDGLANLQLISVEKNQDLTARFLSFN